MSKPVIKKRKMKAVKFARASIITKIVVAILLVYATISLVTLKSTISRAEAERLRLQDQNAIVAEENAGLRYEIDNSTDPQVIRDIARNKLGLVDPGEKIFYDVSN